MARLRLSPEARNDLREIRNFSKATFGAAVARRYMDGFTESFGMLGKQPFAGAPREELVAGVRALSCRSHRIFYSVKTDVIYIIRILHHARDVRSALETHQ